MPYTVKDDLNDELINVKAAIAYMSTDDQADHCFRHEIISSLKHRAWHLEQWLIDMPNEEK